MRTYTRIRCEWDGQKYVMVDCDSFLYSGPLALCDRGQSKAVAQQGMDQSKQDQANATSALTATNADLGKYTTNLNNYLKFGRSTYGSNGEFMRDQNTIANTTAAAGSSALKGNLALNAMRTGENTSGYAGTVAATGQENEQNLTTQLASADSQRLSQLNAINQYGVSASALPAEIQQGIYGTSVGGAASELNPAASAAKEPSFFQQFGGDLISAAGTAAGGAAGCWIAAEIFGGWNDQRTIDVRTWLHTKFRKTFIGRMAMALYLRFGESVADLIHDGVLPRGPFKWLFNRALKAARKG